MHTYMYIYIYICTARRGPRFSSEYTHMEIHKGKKKREVRGKVPHIDPAF